MQPPRLSNSADGPTTRNGSRSPLGSGTTRLLFLVALCGALGEQHCCGQDPIRLRLEQIRRPVRLHRLDAFRDFETQQPHLNPQHPQLEPHPNCEVRQIQAEQRQLQQDLRMQMQQMKRERSMLQHDLDTMERLSGTAVAPGLMGADASAIDTKQLQENAADTIRDSLQGLMLPSKVGTPLGVMNMLDTFNRIRRIGTFQEDPDRLPSIAAHVNMAFRAIRGPENLRLRTSTSELRQNMRDLSTETRLHQMEMRTRRFDSAVPGHGGRWGYDPGGDRIDLRGDKIVEQWHRETHFQERIDPIEIPLMHNIPSPSFSMPDF